AAVRHDRRRARGRADPAALRTLRTAHAGPVALRDPRTTRAYRRRALAGRCAAQPARGGPAPHQRALDPALVPGHGRRLRHREPDADPGDALHPQDHPGAAPETALPPGRERGPGAAAVKFDSYATEYDSHLERGIGLSGEGKDYFARGR